MNWDYRRGTWPHNGWLFHLLYSSSATVHISVKNYSLYVAVHYTHYFTLQQLCSDTLQENVHLSTCDLSWNGFSEVGGLAIADALLVNTNLRELDLSSNRLNYPVAVRVAKALASNDVLEVLKVSFPRATTGHDIFG